MKSVSILHIFLFLFCLALSTHAQESWVSQTASSNSTSLNSVQFVDGNTGWAAGNGGTVLKTTNAGSSWVAELIPVKGYSMNSLHFVSATTGWAVGGSAVDKTTNGGLPGKVRPAGGLLSLRSIL
jgi:photosystem II stability/assembly factor-like uncharacterized protein